MFKSTALASFLLLLGSQPLLAEDPAPSMTSRPIQIISCTSLSDELNDIKPMSFRPGFQIFYLIEGQDIARLKSVAIDSILTADGKEISKYRNGQPAYEKGPFANVSRDGRHCVFSLEVANNQFGKAEGVKVKGHAVVLVGTKQEQQEIALTVGDRQEKKAGPFALKVGTGGGTGLFPVFKQLLPGILGKSGSSASAEKCPVPAEKPGDASTPVPANAPVDAKSASSATPIAPPGTAAAATSGSAAKPILTGTIEPLPAKPATGYITEALGSSGGSDAAGLNVTITGPEKALISVQLLDGDADMQQGYMIEENRRVYDVAKPKSGKITCKINYWTDLKEAKVPIGEQAAIDNTNKK